MIALLSVLLAPVASPAAKVSPTHPHRFLISDTLSQKLLIIERDGSVSWEYPQAGSVYDGARLPNGNVLYCWFVGGKVKPQAGVREVTPDKEIVFEYAVERECHSVQRLPNGHTLIGAGGGPGIGKRVLELDREGKTVWSFEPSDFPPDTNLDWVLGVQRLPNGNTVIANFLGHGKDGNGTSLLEVTPDKQVVWAFREKRIVLLTQILDP